jgi:hypothetical protein
MTELIVLSNSFPKGLVAKALSISLRDRELKALLNANNLQRFG